MPNHLATETSPYLLQHVDNPVDWYPWGDQALSLARQADRPIFLSIGYSACHWCHVMEHESFENADIAELMNQWFVCIKVDREERPDLDQIYMNAVQAMTGSGGWPMSVFLTPELKPFYGGTYWPPTARWGRPGFREILTGVQDAWINRRPAVDAQANELTEHIEQSSGPTLPPSALSEETLRRAMQSIVSAADRTHGGFGSAPKFPHPMDLRLAMRCWRRFRADAGSRKQANEALDVVTLTLDKMARGGIYDHLGGGFARYSTDERWLVPHFEKMLYDNAQLVPAYLEAFQITGQNEFAIVARETLDYVLREMTQSSGGFYSTQDADSEGVEGKFFVWSEAEVDSVLSGIPAELSSDDRKESHPDTKPSEIFKHCYDVTSHGNWEHANILNLSQPIEQAAAALSLDTNELAAILAECRKRLFEVRSRRVWPSRDEKILTSWNGLMIGAMALAANVLNEPRYAAAARAAADFVLARMTVPTDIEPSYRLLHCFKDGQARFNGYLDDYAALVDGLCELYQSVFDAKYLEAAIGLAERMLDQFWDNDSSGFFYTSSDHEELIARLKETQDNATPAGNSLAAMGLLKLARLTGRTDFEEKAVATLEVMSGQLERIPLASGLSLMALDFLLGPTPEIVIATGKTDRVVEDEVHKSLDCHGRIESLSQIHRRFLPNKVIYLRTGEDCDDQLPAVIRSILGGKVSCHGETTAYICEKGVCGSPIIGDHEIARALEQGEGQ
jgi:uncharacterized protein YyaL (SSP411 family)